MSDKLESLLPDFNDMNSLANVIATARLNAHKTKDELEIFIANCVREAYQNQNYWINGKAPTQSYVDKVVAVVGNSKDDAERIGALSEEYNAQMKIYEESKQLLENMRNSLAAFQTISSNRRASL